MTELHFHALVLTTAVHVAVGMAAGPRSTLLPSNAPNHPPTCRPSTCTPPTDSQTGLSTECVSDPRQPLLNSDAVIRPRGTTLNAVLLVKRHAQLARRRKNRSHAAPSVVSSPRGRHHRHGLLRFAFGVSGAVQAQGSGGVPSTPRGRNLSPLVPPCPRAVPRPKGVPERSVADD